MTFGGKDYPLFTYSKKDSIPLLNSWSDNAPVCVVKDGVVSLEHEFFSWISYLIFPYDSFSDHTSSISLKDVIPQKGTFFISPEKLQFKKYTIFGS